MNKLNLTTEAYDAKLAEATKERNAARARYEAVMVNPKATRKMRNQADLDLDFWIGKLSFIAAAG